MTSGRDYYLLACLFFCLQNRFLPAVHSQVRYEATWLGKFSLNPEPSTKTTQTSDKSRRLCELWHSLPLAGHWVVLPPTKRALTAHDPAGSRHSRRPDLCLCGKF